MIFIRESKKNCPSLSTSELKKPVGSRKKDLTFQAESLAMLLPGASWKIKDAPIELDDPDKEISRQTGESLD